MNIYKANIIEKKTNDKVRIIIKAPDIKYRFFNYPTTIQQVQKQDKYRTSTAKI